MGRLVNDPYYQDDSVTLHHGDALEVAGDMGPGSVDCIVTSPPYFGLRDYGVDGQYGLEESPAEYVETMRALFAELRRVLADYGTLWLNLGDSYSSGAGTRNVGMNERWGNAAGQRKQDEGSQGRAPVAGIPPKNLLGMPWRTALALQDDGWILRNDVIWSKPNAMPESVTDRLSSKHEYVFMFSKSRRYWFDLNPIKVPVTTQHDAALNWARSTKEADIPGQNHRQHRTNRTPYAPGMNPQNMKAATGKQHKLPADHPGTRNPGDVWEIPTQPFSAAHFATMPVALAEMCILSGCKPGGTVLDPFSGSGTTGLACERNGRRYVGIDINAEYLDLSLTTRLRDAALNFGAAQ